MTHLGKIRSATIENVLGDNDPGIHESVLREGTYWRALTDDLQRYFYKNKTLRVQKRGTKEQS